MPGRKAVDGQQGAKQYISEKRRQEYRIYGGGVDGLLGDNPLRNRENCKGVHHEARESKEDPAHDSRAERSQ